MEPAVSRNRRSRRGRRSRRSAEPVPKAQKSVTEKVAPARKLTGKYQPSVTTAPQAKPSAVQSVQRDRVPTINASSKAKVSVQNVCTSSIPTVPVLRSGFGPEEEVLAVKQRLGLKTKPHNTVRTQVTQQWSPSMASPEFYWNGYRRTIRFGARSHGMRLQPVQYMQSSSASTWILKDDGLIECSDGIWSIGMDIDDGVSSVNMTESTISAETPDEDAIVNVTVDLAARRKRRRNRRKRGNRV